MHRGKTRHKSKRIDNSRKNLITNDIDKIELYLTNIGFVNDKLREQLKDVLLDKPFKPYLDNVAFETIKKNLHPTDIMLEYGSGFSTLYFSKYVRRYISIEHQYKWTAFLQAYLRSHPELHNIELYTLPILKLKSEYTELEYTFYDHFITYIGIPHYDVVFIDGVRRYYCGLSVIPFITHDTFVYVDNWKKYCDINSSIENCKKLSECYDIIEIEDSDAAQLILKKEYEGVYKPKNLIM